MVEFYGCLMFMMFMMFIMYMMFVVEMTNLLIT